MNNFIRVTVGDEPMIVNPNFITNIRLVNMKDTLNNKEYDNLELYFFGRKYPLTIQESYEELMNRIYSNDIPEIEKVPFNAMLNGIIGSFKN